MVVARIFSLLSHAAITKFREFYVVGRLALWLLAACAGYAAWIVYTADAREVVALAANFPPHRLVWGNTTLEWEKLRLGLAVAAVALAALALALPRRNRHWRIDWPQAWRELAQGWHSLLPRQRRLALGLFVGLTGLRIIVSRLLATFDDAASYEFFARKSLLAVSAYYPAPNNHVFSNTLSWLFYQAYPGYWWSMRVPVLLVSTVGTAGWFLGLVRRSNFRVAVLASTLFGFLELSLFYAAEGRGYALLLALSSLGFFCTLALAGPTATTSAPKVASAWIGLAVAGALGLYTVPTFAYFLVAAYGWLGLCWLRKGCRYRLASLGLLGAATLLGAGLLYTPLLFVSGPESLFQNVYVRPMQPLAFFQQLPAYLWEVEGAFMGESHNGVLASLHLGSLAAGAVLVGFAGLVGAARRGRLPTRLAASILNLGVPALWFALVPYVLLLVQHVQAPSRTLLFKAAFTFLLVGLEADWLLFYFEPKTRWLRTGLGIGIGLWAGVQSVQLYRSNELRLSYLNTPRTAAQWLLKQPPGPVLAVGNSAFTLAHLRFYLHAEEPTSALEIDATPQPGVRYRYLINPPVVSLAAVSPALPRLHLAPAVNNDALDIVARW